MDWIVETLRKYPEIAIYLALAGGFLIGPRKIGKFSLGNVTGVLLIGVLIGQLEITISPDVKSVFFLMFLFAVGYGVGPQFFRGIRSDGIPQAIFAVVICVAVLLSTYVAALLAGYNVGQAAGLLGRSHHLRGAVITNKELEGKTLRQIAEMEGQQGRG